MKVYTCSRARQQLSEILNTARYEEVRIRRRLGDSFSVRLVKESASPFDVTPVSTRASTKDILDAIADVRKGRARRSR